ncbi:MAG: hypothetical protein AABW79_02640 [Nanoarchaeota archaeon]
MSRKGNFVLVLLVSLACIVCLFSLIFIIYANGLIGDGKYSEKGSLRLIEEESIDKKKIVEFDNEQDACSGVDSYSDCSYRPYDDGGKRKNSGSSFCSDGLDNDSDGLTDLVDPGCSDANDNSEEDSLQRERLYAYGWDSNARGYNNILPMVNFFPFSVGTGNPPLWPQTTPESAKAILDTYPEGHRVMILFQLGLYHDLLSNNPEDKCLNQNRELTNFSCIWWDNGVANVSAEVDSFFANYSAIGGEVDSVIIDFERGFGNFQIGSNLSDSEVVERWDAIQNDPRTREEIIPLIGFDDLTSVSNFFSGGDNYHIWNAVQVARLNKFLNVAFYEPVKRYYPNVNASNYESSFNGAVECPVPLKDINGHGGYCLNVPNANQAGPRIFGTHQGTQAYGWLGQITRPGREPGNGTYELTPFNSFRYSVNQVRAAKLNSDAGLMPWIAFRSYTGDGPDRPIVAMGNTDYYQESVMHIILLDPDNLIFFNPGVSREDNELVSNIISETNNLVGFSDRRSLVSEMADWDADYVLSGIESGGRKVWRFTPKSEFELDESSDDVIIRTSRVKISFDSAVIFPSNVSQKGLWIVQDVNTGLPSIEGR